MPVATAKDEVAELKRSEGGDILTFGSVTTWSPLLEAGLVDELHVLVGPALLGDGSKLFTGGPGLAPSARSAGPPRLAARAAALRRERSLNGPIGCGAIGAEPRGHPGHRGAGIPTSPCSASHSTASRAASSEVKRGW